MKIAIQGCSHGELDLIYDTLQYIEQLHEIKIDLLLCCGDFESIRSEKDLDSLAVPPKYLDVKNFPEYFSGKKKAPILTIFIGGNHEASNYLQELFYGGWAAHNIYYLGTAGVVNFGGLRIGGLSGIYKPYSFFTGHHESPPYSEDQKRSVYHVRELEVFRLSQLSPTLDIFLSHDWPQNIVEFGNKQLLFKKKPFLSQDQTFGNPATWTLLQQLQPRYWFSAHMHVKFPAIVSHQNTGKETKFLALSKVVPNSDFLQILDVPDVDPSQPKQLQLDIEWLAILAKTQHLINRSKSVTHMPTENFHPSKEEIDKIKELVGSDLLLTPEQFEKREENPNDISSNPQTIKILKILDKLQENKGETPKKRRTKC